jgi:hypothetical protein
MKLTDSISTESLKQELAKNVLHLAKIHSMNLVEETGIEPSLDEEDVRNYVEKVLLNEIHRK